LLLHSQNILHIKHNADIFFVVPYNFSKTIILCLGSPADSKIHADFFTVHIHIYHDIILYTAKKARHFAKEKGRQIAQLEAILMGGGSFAHSIRKAQGRQFADLFP
jgi:hypothetical protein